MNRRGFLGSCLALAAAPAIVRADALMRVVPVNTTVLGIADAAAFDFFSGAVREIRAYDVVRDEFLWRYDVACVDGKSFCSGSTNKDVALAHLKRMVQEHGSAPAKGVLELPGGIDHARFL